jgi:hypothetical protein
MAHNYEAGGSSVGSERSHQFMLDEAGVLYRHHIPVPTEHHLLHGWHMSAAGHTVPPPPLDGPELRSLIEQWRAQMMPK